MKLKLALAAIVLAHSASAFADVKCGDFTLTASNDGFMHINGVRPESQKITFLRKKDDFDNIKYEWIVATSEPGKWLGMEFVKRRGNNRILNVQVVQANMSGPQNFATYDCIKTS